MINTCYNSVQMKKSVLEKIIQDGSSTTAIVYLVLLFHQNKKTELCFPSIKKISQETSLSESTIKREIKKLKNIGLIKINHSPTNAKNNTYEFIYDDTTTLQDVTEMDVDVEDLF